jgi:hypothetical protein
MTLRQTLVGLAIAASAVATGPRPAWPQTVHFVLPWQTDGAIDEWQEPHVVEIDHRVPARDLLFLHLPGSYDVPANSMQVLRHAAHLGYPAIGLRYPNEWTVSTLCSWSTDEGCFEKVRLEIVNGSDTTPHVTVNHANSITNRLEKLLAFLDGRFPDDEWSRFLEADGGVAWSKVIVSGHSQGAGHAAMIGHLHRVARVAMFAGPADYSARFDRPAPWLGGTAATPADDRFGFGHTGDALVPADRLVKLWTVLGLAERAAAVDVDHAAPPFGTSHMLLTSAEPDGSGPFPNHGSVVTDAFTPKNLDGSPRFAEVWSAVCFAKVETGSGGSRYWRVGKTVAPID